MNKFPVHVKKFVQQFICQFIRCSRHLSGNICKKIPLMERTIALNTFIIVSVWISGITGYTKLAVMVWPYCAGLRSKELQKSTWNQYD